MKLKIKKGDTVKVIAGNNRGETGRVLEIIQEKMRILVDGVNIRKVHQKPNPQNQEGGIVKLAKPIHYSNVMLLDSEGKVTKLGTRVEEKGGRKEKIRYAKSNGKDIN
jgi:large subunit ribosomal protein L24